eukprot:GHVO01010576.1.p1 GENE.GHVO01010576.1~~GHVO01010576.1.p1  ORF type:complete len:538 (-),score=140.38 GHVO01010576.1:1039-2454(-)
MRKYKDTLTDCDRLTAQADSMERDLVSTSSKNEDLEKLLREKTEEIKTVQRLYDELHEEEVRLSECYASAQSVARSSECRIEGMVSRIKDLEEEVMVLSARDASSTELCVKKESVIEELQKRLSDVTERLEESSCMNEQRQADIEARLMLKEAECTQVKAKLDAAETHLQESTEDAIAFRQSALAVILEDGASLEFERRNNLSQAAEIRKLKSSYERVQEMLTGSEAMRDMQDQSLEVLEAACTSLIHWCNGTVEIHTREEMLRMEYDVDIDPYEYDRTVDAIGMADEFVFQSSTLSMMESQHGVICEAHSSIMHDLLTLIGTQCSVSATNRQTLEQMETDLRDKKTSLSASERRIDVLSRDLSTISHESTESKRAHAMLLDEMKRLEGALEAAKDVKVDTGSSEMWVSGRDVGTSLEDDVVEVAWHKHVRAIMRQPYTVPPTDYPPPPSSVHRPSWASTRVWSSRTCDKR